MSEVPDRFLNRLAGKTAIITGAGASSEGFGTGAAMALLFAGEGARICVVDHDEQAAARTLRHVEAIGGEVCVTIGDVTDAEAVESMVAHAARRFGQIDILVNNVGVSERALPADVVDLAQWRRVLDVNVQSALLMAKHVVPTMRAAGRGAILNIASVAGVLAYGSLAYGASKAAMLQLTRDLAVLHGRDGIRVNALIPGHIYTPMVANLLTAELRDMRRKAGPLGLEGDAWDVARAALFLTSDDSRFITGACLPVDGGVAIVGSIEAARLMSEPDPI